MRILFFLFFQLTFSIFSFAGGVRGHLKDEGREPLAFATIYIQQTGSGTVTNQDGFYEIYLPKGNYTLVFQFLGYVTEVREVYVPDEFITLDLILRQQSLDLNTVEILDGREDPAYTIMRKAIAKASYHRQQVDSYSARVYMKGSGRLLDSPGLFRKMIEKEGIDSTSAFLSESVSDISYLRPNTYKEKVVSIRKQGNDNNTGPNQYVNASFYDPKLDDAVSPLSPKAFGYYKFAFEGSFIDRGYEINKIRVTPRQPGEGVFDGHIFIVEDWWSIHSLDLRAYKLGIKVDIRQIFAPIENKAWMPVTQKYIVGGKFFGFRFEYNYLATVSGYKIQLNPALEAEFDVIDENIEPEKAAEIEQKPKPKIAAINEKLAAGEELTRKELRSLMKEYLKEEKQKDPEPEVVENRSFEIDSTAHIRDTLFWDSIRPIPLTKYEVKGYQKVDSLAVVEKEKEAAEGGEKKRKKGGQFGVDDLLFGDSYKIGKNTSFGFDSPITTVQFNTVEGYAFDFPVFIRGNVKSDKKVVTQTARSWRFGIAPRYAFAREKMTGKAALNFNWRKDLRSINLRLEGGRYTFQLNENNPISPAVNTMWTLIGERNYLKLYEKDFGKIAFLKSWTDNFKLSVSGEFARRYQLENTVKRPWINYEKRAFTSNIPILESGENAAFATHEALLARLGFEWLAWQKYRLSNGQKEVIQNSSPLLFGQLTKGIDGVFGSDVNYNLAELGVKSRWTFSAGSVLSVKVTGGAFFGGDSLAFPDYKHFPGNRTEIVTSDPVESFRLLDYYAHSTSDRFLQMHVHHQFRKFLLTQIPELWLIGLKENLFVNYLATPTPQNYTEIGYGIDHIFKIFRIEGIVAFQDLEYADWGIRIGIASTFGGAISTSSNGNDRSVEVRF